MNTATSPTAATPPTIEEAIKAARGIFANIENSHHTSDAGVMFAFLRHLETLAEPELHLDSEGDGYIIEGALQHGFEFIDNNVNLFVVHGEALIKYVRLNREGAARMALQDAARNALPHPSIVLSMADDVKLGALVTEFGNTPLMGPGRRRADVLTDLRKLFSICHVAMIDRDKRDLAIANAASKATYNATFAGGRKSAFCDLDIDLPMLVAQVDAAAIAAHDNAQPK